MNSWKFHKGQKVERLSDDGSNVIRVGEVTNIGHRFVLVKYNDATDGTRVVENPKHLRPVEEKVAV